MNEARQASGGVGFSYAILLQHAGHGARGGHVQGGPQLLRQRGQRHHAGTHHHA